MQMKQKVRIFSFQQQVEDIIRKYEKYLRLKGGLFKIVFLTNKVWMIFIVQYQTELRGVMYLVHYVFIFLPTFLEMATFLLHTTAKSFPFYIKMTIFFFFFIYVKSVNMIMKT